MTTRFTRTEPRTDPELLALIEKAKAHVMTPEEVEAQRISWVIGQMGMTHPEWTREETEARVREALRLPPAGAPTRAALEAEVARLREWCSAAADAFDGMLAALESSEGIPFAKHFPKAAREIRKSSAFSRAAAEGRGDGTLYEAEITKANKEASDARFALALMREDCAQAAQKRAPATSGPDYGMASETERRKARAAKQLAYDIAADIRALPLPTADCRLPRSEGAPPT